jgi:hypothetical protein
MFCNQCDQYGSLAQEKNTKKRRSTRSFGVLCLGTRMECQQKMSLAGYQHTTSWKPPPPMIANDPLEVNTSTSNPTAHTSTSNRSTSWWDDCTCTICYAISATSIDGIALLRRTKCLLYTVTNKYISTTSTDRVAPPWLTYHCIYPITNRKRSTSATAIDATRNDIHLA